MILRGVIDQSVSILDGLVSRLGDNLLNSVRISLEKSYSDNFVECPLALTYVFWSDATSLYW